MADADDRTVPKTVGGQSSLTAERIERIRARIEAGAYASEPVLQATARAILERGDL